jgi:hypothetical protein
MFLVRERHSNRSASPIYVRDQKGTNEYTVPDDFRFTINGKKMAVSELKPGMKGTATVTTTTTIKPVAVTGLRLVQTVRQARTPSASMSAPLPALITSPRESTT